MIGKMKLGKQAPAVDPRVPHLSDRCKLARPLPAVDWTPAVKAFTALGNNQYGDCTAAAALHTAQTLLANASGSSWVPTDQDALNLYAATSGFPKVDEGAVELDVLKYWASTGIPTPAGQDTIAFTTLNPRNLDELKLSIQWFGSAYIGVAMPLSCQTQGHLWDVPAGGTKGAGAPNSWGGHALCLLAYDDKTFTAISWGEKYKMTYAFAQTYIDEAYAVLSRHWLDVAGIAPSNIGWQELQADMKAITG